MTDFAGQSGYGLADREGAPPAWLHEVVAATPIDSMVDLIVELCSAQAFAGYSDDLEFCLKLRASVRENLEALKNELCGVTSLEGLTLTEPLKFASAQAHLGIPQTSMQKSYRVSFLTQWTEWTGVLRDYISANGIPQEEATDALLWLTRVLFRYQDVVASLVAEAYSREGEALSRSRQHVQQRIVREILKSDENELTPSEVDTIGYLLDQSHVAVLLPNLAWGAANQILLGLRAVALPNHSLVYPMTLQSTVIWFGKRGGWKPESLRSIQNELQRLGMPASVSGSNDGFKGFKQCYDEVRQVERVRVGLNAVTETKVLCYEDVALEILLLRDQQRAIRFVQSELGPLSNDTVEAERLRETLEASFKCGSHVATADYLQLHEHTVRNRLHKAEELLGRSLLDRRIEIQVALRIRKLVVKRK